MVFQGDFGGVLDLLRATAHHGRQTRGRHGRGRAHLALTADFGAGDRGIMLDDAADRGGGQQVVADAVLVGVGMEMQVIADGRRHDAGSPVCRRGDDATAGCVLLVDRHGVDREPVIGE